MTPAERAKLWRLADPERTKQLYRRVNLKRKFGLTLDQYQQLLEKQNYCCAVCLKHQDSFKMKLAVDHDHKTMFIRGLLCNYCNRRVIGRHTDSNKFERAAAYLKQHTGWKVPPKVKRRKKRGIRKRTKLSRRI